MRHQHAIELYRALNDPMAQAHAHQNLAWALYRKGRGEEALDHVWQALDRFRAARTGPPAAPPTDSADPAPQDLCAFFREALSHVDDAIHPEGQANTWQALGVVHHGLGEYDQAIHCDGRALDLRRALFDPYGDAEILIHLGHAHHATGDQQAAHDAWRQALTILDLHHPDADAVRAKLRHSANSGNCTGTSHERRTAGARAQPTGHRPGPTLPSA